jgi:hypothetical protein
LRRLAFELIGQKSDAESAPQADAGALVTQQARQISLRMERLTVSAPQAHCLVGDGERSPLPMLDRSVDRHVRLSRIERAA